MPQVVHEIEKPKRVALLRKLMIAAVLLLVVTAGAVVLIVRLTAPKVTLNQLEDIKRQAAVMNMRGDLAGALKLYDTAIAHADSDTTTGNLYLDKAVLELNAKILDGAGKDALVSEKLLKGDSPSAFVATVYLAQGDKVKAAQHLRTAAERANKNGPAGPSKQSYLNKAVMLEQGTP